MTLALEATVRAPIVSLRNPLYAGVQVGMPCPAPSTVAGFLASAIGGWQRMPQATRFAMAFHAHGQGRDLETYHPLHHKGSKTDPIPRERPFHADVTLTIWLLEDIDTWEAALRRPVWPMRLGRSQDLASARTRRIELTAGRGRQGHALVPAELTQAGALLRMTTATSEDRSRTRWDAYRYAASGTDEELDSERVTPEGQAVILLPPAHPAAALEPAR